MFKCSILMLRNALTRPITLLRKDWHYTLRFRKDNDSRDGAAFINV